MSKVKNEKQSEYEFSCEIEIRVSDINYGGHVGNSQILGIAHDARLKLLKSIGLSEINLGDGKTGLVVSDITANFKAEIFLGAKVIVKSHIGDIEETGFRIFHCIENSQKTAALVETGIVAFDYEKRKRAKLPEEFFNALRY